MTPGEIWERLHLRGVEVNHDGNFIELVGPFDEDDVQLVRTNKQALLRWLRVADDIRPRSPDDGWEYDVDVTWHELIDEAAVGRGSGGEILQGNRATTEAKHPYKKWRNSEAVRGWVDSESGLTPDSMTPPAHRLPVNQFFWD